MEGVSDLALDEDTLLAAELKKFESREGEVR